MTKNNDANINKIQAQVDRWDLFARLVPTAFLVVCSILIFTGIVDFQQAFWAGLGLFAITAVTWWFWTIYTIRNLVITLSRASKNLAEARGEFKGIVKDLEEFRDDEA